MLFFLEHLLQLILSGYDQNIKIVQSIPISIFDIRNNRVKDSPFIVNITR